MHTLEFDNPNRDAFDDDQAKALQMLDRLTGKGALRALKKAKREVTSMILAQETRLDRLQRKADDSLDSGITMSHMGLIKNIRVLITTLGQTADGIEDALYSLRLSAKTSATDALTEINAMPRVLATGTYGGHFAVALAARHTYGGQQYDLGDWIVCFEDPADRERLTHDDVFETIEVRSGLRWEWQRDVGVGYPYYGFEGIGFCYGERNETLIALHARRGNIVQAVIAALSVLSSVNEEDAALIPDAFNYA